MAGPKGFILYRIWCKDFIAYLGRTKQPLQSRMHGHMFAAPMHRTIDIHNVSGIVFPKIGRNGIKNYLRQQAYDAP